jgi:hypothetical protein
MDTKGVEFKVNGGTNSFARTVMMGSAFNMQAGQFGIAVEGTGTFQSADVYDSFLEARGNIAGSGARAISLTNGGDVRLGMVNFNFEGPNTSYFLYVDNTGTSGISAVGTASSNGLSIYNSGTSDEINIPQLNNNFAIQDPPFANSEQQALNSKVLWGGNNLRYGIPDDTFLYGYFQLFKRVTTNPSDPEVDAEPSTGNTQTNLLYCNLHGCGFGAGYGPSATRGGTNNPTYSLSFNGTFGGHGIATLDVIQGSGTASLAPGASGQVGTGATAVCAASHRCDSLSGTALLVTGTGSTTPGTVLTITTGITRPGPANCTVNGNSTINFSAGADNTSISITSYSALPASTTIVLVWTCQN